jgi:putative FmdB family regulatory protein
MPIYEYECRGCGHRFEYLVLPSSATPECPACQQRDLQKLISLCAVSSESTREGNLARARRKAKAIRHDKQYEEHKQLHAEHD